MKDFMKISTVNGKQFWKVLELSTKGRNELDNPSFMDKKQQVSYQDVTTEITQLDKNRFAALHDFLHGFNDHQKKAIIADKLQVLCLAGAGSGKTSVLTKRIEFLIRYCSIQPEKNNNE